MLEKLLLLKTFELLPNIRYVLVHGLYHRNSWSTCSSPGWGWRKNFCWIWIEEVWLVIYRKLWTFCSDQLFNIQCITTNNFVAGLITWPCPCWMHLVIIWILWYNFWKNYSNLMSVAFSEQLLWWRKKKWTWRRQQTWILWIPTFLIPSLPMCLLPLVSKSLLEGRNWGGVSRRLNCRSSLTLVLGRSRRTQTVRQSGAGVVTTVHRWRTEVRGSAAWTRPNGRISTMHQVISTLFLLCKINQ